MGSIMDATLAIDYNGGLATLAHESYATVVATITDEMPSAWLARYERMCTGPTNALLVRQRGFDYLFDYAADLIARGLLPAVPGREDRLVVVFGCSQRPAADRPASRIAGFPGSDERGDRGHFIAHASGGGSDINLFHQDAHLNRGWSPQGKRYREMERYCAANPGLFCFSRPIYADASARPVELEFGVLRPDCTFWIELFDNRPVT
jgi:hypothetical protein